MTDDLYRQWLAQRRELAEPADLADGIMSRVTDVKADVQKAWWLRLAEQIEQSWPARWAAYSGALAVGSLPFLFLAHVAKFVI